jgi:hypothetical protein
MLGEMRSIRQFFRARRSGGAIAVCMAYALAIQSLIASVGLGMSAAASPDRADFVICSFSLNSHAPGSERDGQKPHQQPQCPFCFVAAQSAGPIASTDEVPVLPAYVGLRIVGSLSGPIIDGRFIPAFRRSTGDPRAPPPVPSDA